MPDDQLLDLLLAAAPRLTGVAGEWWGDGVRTHLLLSLAVAETVLAFPLPDETDPAPVFRA